ncbi:MAG: hypothetical protein LBJ25_06990 [Candidatus Margulisbacteria bacterium]|jgi:hypothetical protein|nr:hypothetical protein [Candidatus Margulisiibacteriota bacterium]
MLKHFGKTSLVMLILFGALFVNCYAGGHDHRHSQPDRPQVVVIEKRAPHKAPPPKVVVVEKKTVEYHCPTEKHTDDTRTFGAILIMLGGFLLL